MQLRKKSTIQDADQSQPAGMCGIAGIFAVEGRQEYIDRVEQMLCRLQHRGADDSGLVWGDTRQFPLCERGVNAQVVLGHRRLSIIDLSSAAVQPMAYQNARFWISYNGELYNYIEIRDELRKQGTQFVTDSDTEVVLAAYARWGVDCLKKFNGMFAFAIWDTVNRQLFCARDHLGIKPLFYRYTKGIFEFASESRAITNSRQDLSPESVIAFLGFMYVPGTASIFKDIYKLPPGHYLIVNGGEPEITCWWSVSDTKINYSLSAGEAKERIDELINESVYRQLRSDVTVGSFLSGGLDSSLLVSKAADLGERLHSFSVGFEGAHIDELPFAREVARKWDTIHHELTLTSSDSLSLAREALSKSTEPIADPASGGMLAVSKFAASEGVKVLLNGSGGDEIFGGYNRYVNSSLRRRQLNVLQALPMAKHLVRMLPDSVSKLRFLDPRVDMILAVGGSKHLLNEILGRGQEQSAFFQKYFDEFCKLDVNPGDALLRQRMQFDIQYYLPDELLLLLDQVSMSQTVEGRVPYLDLALVEFAWQLKPEHHVGGGNTKKLQRKLAETVLGSEFANRKKSGFGGPINTWIVSSLEELKQEIKEFSTGIDEIDEAIATYSSRFLDNNALTVAGDPLDVYKLFSLSCWLQGLES